MRFRHRLFAICALWVVTPGIGPAIPASAIEQVQGKYESLQATISELTRAAKYSDAGKVASDYAALAKREAGERSVHYARAISWIAYLQQVQGRLADAGPLFEQALAIYEQIAPANDAELATAINNLGAQQWLMGQYAEAETSYKRALEMREKVLQPDDPEIAASLNNIAHIYTLLERPAEAELLQRRALAIREKKLKANDPMLAQSRQNLATALEMQGRYKEAEPLLRQAVEIRRQSQVEWHPEIAGATAKLARNLFAQGRFEEAESRFKLALEIRAKSQAPEHTDVAGTQEDLALTYIEQGRCAESEKLLLSVLKVRQKALLETNPDMALAYSELARAADCQAHSSDALGQARLATKIYVQRGIQNSLSGAHFQNHVDYAWKVFSKGRSEALLEEALILSQRSAQSLTANAVSRMAVRLAVRDPQLQAAMRERDRVEETIAELERQLDAALALPPEQRREIADRARAKLSETNTRISDIDRRIREGFPKYAELVRPGPLNITGIRALLGPDEALVSFLPGRDATYVWAITREAAAWTRAGIGLAELAQLIGRLRGGLEIDPNRIRAAKSGLFDLGLAYELYARLFKEIEPTVAKKTHVLVVPAGPLIGLPPHLLLKEPPAIARPTGEQLAEYRKADWLVRHHAISVIPSVTTLKVLRGYPHREEAPKPLIGFGNPQFGLQAVADARSMRSPHGAGGFSTYWKGAAADLAALRGLEQLSETEDELKAVAETLGAPASDLHFGSGATEAAVKQADSQGVLAQYRIVYFATHALVAGDFKGLAEPALALTVPATASDVDDGLLTASEVATLKLNAEWVVLSACNTASPEARGAEGLSGLARAFFHAGARSLLVTQWIVDSEAVMELMKSTFGALKKDPGIGHAEALRQAMVALIADKSVDINAYPMLWAPFVVVGEGAR